MLFSFLQFIKFYTKIFYSFSYHYSIYLLLKYKCRVSVPNRQKEKLSLKKAAAFFVTYICILIYIIIYDYQNYKTFERPYNPIAIFQLHYHKFLFLYASPMPLHISAILPVLAPWIRFRISPNLKA